MRDEVETSGRGAQREAVAAAAERIRGYVRRTPSMMIEGAALGLSQDVMLKLEHLQVSGSFKARGAFNRLLRDDAPTVAIAASGGNHGAAVACAAARLGVAAEIFVPEISSASKRAVIERYGAALHVGGAEFADALAAAETRAAALGAPVLHAYDHVETMIGQGTIAPEIEADAAELMGGLDAVVVAVGGGGLVGGLSAWFGRDAAIIAVEPEQAPTFHAARGAGAPVDVAVSGIAADALGARRIGQSVFPTADAVVADSVLVTDDAIREAQARLWDACRIAAEPAGATPLAALISGVWRPEPGARVALIVCGANAGREG